MTIEKVSCIHVVRTHFRFRCVVYILFFIISSPTVLAQSWSTEDGTAEFASHIPLHTFRGTSHNLTGAINLADSTVDFFLDLSTLKTGNGKRDKDMRLTLDVKQYPFGEFYGKLVSDFDPAEPVSQPVTVAGLFTIHGVSQNVRVNGTLQVTDDHLALDAAWELNLEDYAIKPPRLLIIKVDKIQKIQIHATLAPVTSQ